MTTFLTQDQLRDKAPSIFTKTAFEKTGSAYEVISTKEVLNALFDMGFGVTKAMETNPRKKERVGFSKHMLRLRRRNEEQINGFYPEVVLINSHDGSTAYQLRAGIYRMVCSNGMIVGDELFTHKVRHQGDVVERVAGACNDIIEVFPTAVKTVKEWQEIELSPEQQQVYASSAKMLKWNTTEDATVEVETQTLLRPRRFDDKKNDLWTTFNVVQENMIKGGVITRNKETRQRRKSRGVNSVYENTRLNTALWTLTNQMASLAK